MSKKQKKDKGPPYREDGANINCECGADVCETCPPYGRVYAKIVQITTAAPVGTGAHYADRPTLIGLTTEGVAVFWSWQDTCWMGLGQFGA